MESCMVRRKTSRPPATRLLAAVLGVVCSTAWAEGHIEVKLEPVEASARGAKVVLTLANTGDAPVSILRWATPFARFGGRLPGAIFQVTDADGREVPYRGSWVYLGRLLSMSFHTIAPGEVLTKEVDLWPEYRFEPQRTYSVRYELNLTHRPDPDVVSATERSFFHATTQHRAVSNEITVTSDAPAAEVVAR
jgi:hypothetical protein